MTHAQLIEQWLRADPVRIEALEVAARLELEDWCIAAGFVRNLVWDRVHDKVRPTPLNDIDLIYFDRTTDGAAADVALEAGLKSALDLPWSVKNQARMHLRNGHRPYSSTVDAMSHWVEMETAVGVRWSAHDGIRVVAPLGLDRLFASTITLNPGSGDRAAFRDRIRQKRWLELWPALRVVEAEGAGSGRSGISERRC